MKEKCPYCFLDLKDCECSEEELNYYRSLAIGDQKQEIENDDKGMKKE